MKYVVSLIWISGCWTVAERNEKTIGLIGRKSFKTRVKNNHDFSQTRKQILKNESTGKKLSKTHVFDCGQSYLRKCC